MLKLTFYNTQGFIEIVEVFRNEDRLENYLLQVFEEEEVSVLLEYLKLVDSNGTIEVSELVVL